MTTLLLTQTGFTRLQHVWAALVGAGIGLLGGLFGKGGSAVATPILQLLGFPGFIAVASPLPATAPATVVAAWEYNREHMVHWWVVRWSVAIGIPATIIGSWLSKYTGAKPLLLITALLVIWFGASFLLRPSEGDERPGEAGPHAGLAIRHPRLMTSGIAVAVGLISGLLANAGGFLLAPLYARLLRLPLKTAFACSLVVAAVLAVPGTLVHWYLGHIAWSIAFAMAVGTVPLSYLGARIAIRTRPAKLERAYGLALLVIGVLALIRL